MGKGVGAYMCLASRENDLELGDLAEELRVPVVQAVHEPASEGNLKAARTHSSGEQ